MYTHCLLLRALGAAKQLDYLFFTTGSGGNAGGAGSNDIGSTTTGPEPADLRPDVMQYDLLRTRLLHAQAVSTSSHVNGRKIGSAMDPP